jgi:hypothetical protein
LEKAPHPVFGKKSPVKLISYHVLQRAQASAVPVFLGAINLAKIYFLHGAGEIRHMLLMAWGSENLGKLRQQPKMQLGISRSILGIRRLGVIHRDLRLLLDV